MNRVAFALVAGASLLTACTRPLIVAEHPAASSGPSTAATLGIPPGHLPPPGQCRIWIPGTPPGHQSAPGSCAALAPHVPLNGWLVYRPSRDKKQVKVSVYDHQRPGVVVVIRYYEASTGRLVREEPPTTRR